MNKSDIGFGISDIGIKKALLGVVAVCVTVLVGCQQKMADQPAHRPYEVSTMFANGQSVRPLQTGVIHRNQPLSDDPLVTWLTVKGKAPEHTANYTAWIDSQITAKTLTASDKDGLLATKPQAGSPNDNANFVETVPFEMTREDLLRGQTLYTAVCAECHGGAGWGNGKIPERGFLRPPSYHLDAEGKAKDWSSHNVQKDGTTAPNYTGNPQGTSRGFYKYGIEQPLKDVNIGYIYQVIYWGYGGMASHETQLPKAEDRWRVAAYVRALQMSQAADPSKIPANSHAKKLIEEIGKPKVEAKHSEDKH
jgi:Cytochrome c